MCIEETCIPYCATHINDPICKDYGKSPKSNEPETTGEVCVNAEYDALVPKRTLTFCDPDSYGQFCWDSTTPAHYERDDENVCVDVYKDDMTDATNRLNSLIEEKKTKEGWKNDKYYCMYGATEFLMSVFQPASLEYSDKYCGKASEVAAAEPAVEEDTGVEAVGRGSDKHVLVYETKLMPRTDIEVGRWVEKKVGDCYIDSPVSWSTNRAGSRWW